MMSGDEVCTFLLPLSPKSMAMNKSENVWDSYLCIAQFTVDQKGKDINSTQKEIGLKRKNKQSADDLIEKKTQFEKEKKNLEAIAAEKEAQLKTKATSIGNIVHDSVPVSDNEVCTAD